MLRLSSFLVICLGIVLSGCISQIASFDDHIKGWVGRPISEYIKVKEIGNVDRSNYVGTERITEHENGNLLYEIPYKYCPVFFEVDKNGIIVQITTEDDKDCY